MIAQILSNTPKWVFVLFFVLLALGASQMRTSQKTKGRVLIIPIVLFFLSIAGVYSAFGTSLWAILAWAKGYVVALALVGRGFARGSSYEVSTKQITVAGSAVPLALMMCIFFLKYFVGVSMAMKVSFTSFAAFPIVISLLYGAFSGAFAGRAWQLIKLTKTH